jgi:transposase
VIELRTGTRIWIAAGYTDLWRGFQGLTTLVETVLEQAPYSGHVFVFRGKRGECPWHLETFWAPSALRGIEGEQTLAAVIVNRSLHLMHTIPVPIPGLLVGMEEELRKACSN